jgi:RHS repeat-associated protein
MMSTWATIFTFLMLASGTHSVNPRTQRINDPVGHPTGYTQVLEEHITTPAAGASDPFSLITYPSSLTTVYAFGQDLISQDRLISGSGVSQSGVWNLSYYLYDGGGHVRALANEVGTLTDTYTFDAFGVLIAKTGSTENNYLYRGEQFDPDLHLYHQRARYLNTDTGRFWTQDTYEGSPGTPASLHKYLYANGDPVSGWDPSGNVTVVEMAQTIRLWAFRIITPVITALKIERRIKWKRIYLGIGPGTTSEKVGHSFIFAETLAAGKPGGSGTKFDFNPDEDYFRDVLSPGGKSKSVPGVILERETRTATLRRAKNKLIRVADLTPVGYGIWRASNRLFNPDLKYKMFSLPGEGTFSCYTWAGESALSAFAISKNPFF